LIKKQAAFSHEKAALSLGLYLLDFRANI